MLRKDNFVPGEFYHIYNRGIDKRIIFKTVRDYERFIMLLYVANSDKPIRLDNLVGVLHKSYQEVFECARGKQLVSIGAWTLMPNHFHILIKEEVDGGVSKFMKKLGTAYSMYFNLKYQRTGALFGGPFKSKNISDDIYLKHLFGYFALNPLELKFPEWKKIINKRNKTFQFFLEKYQYSSYVDYVGVNRCESSILSKDMFPEYFLNKKDFTDFIDDYLSFDPELGY